MATSTISNTVTDPSGVAVSGAVINARLKPNGVGYRVSDGTEVATLVSTTSNASGFWSLALERNSNITPSGSYYEIEERIPDNAGGSRNWAISVGTASTTVYAALTVPPAPTGAAIYYLTQTAADARYQALGSFGNVTAVNTATYAGIATSASRSDHQHSLSPAIAGSGITITGSGLVVVSGLANVNAATGNLFTQTGTTTVTQGVPQGQIQYNSNSVTLNVFSGAVNIPVGPLGAWRTFIPTVQQTGAVSLSTALGRFMQVGGLIKVQVQCIASGAGGAASAVIISGAAPLPAARSTYTAANDVVGTFMYSGGGTFYSGYATIATPATPTFQGISYGQANYMGAAGPAAQIANGYIMSLDAEYEAAN